MAEKGYVFISYSSKNEEFVKKLVGFLGDNGISYWKAPEMIPAGSNYAKEIPKAIVGSSIFLLVLSKDSQQSIWVEKEIDLAICNRKTVIPVSIDDFPMSDMYRFYLNNVQVLQMSNDLQSEFIQIKDTINNMLNPVSSDKEKSMKTVMVSQNSNAEKSNALRINRIPTECEFCGGAVFEEFKGIYKCVDCGKESYDDFQKVRNYLEKVGSAPSAVIARNTGVPMRTIDYFWQHEYLEIPSNADVRIACQNCGAPIRTGTLCDACKLVSTDKSGSALKGVWHSKVWKR